MRFSKLLRKKVSKSFSTSTADLIEDDNAHSPCVSYPIYAVPLEEGGLRFCSVAFSDRYHNSLHELCKQNICAVCFSALLSNSSNDSFMTGKSTTKNRSYDSTILNFGVVSYQLHNNCACAIERKKYFRFLANSDIFPNSDSLAVHQYEEANDKCCRMCGKSGGVILYLQNTYFHVFCANYYYQSHQNNCGIFNTVESYNLPGSLTCVCCGESKGLVVKCASVGCNLWAHPICSVIVKSWRMSKIVGTGPGKMAVLFCPLHKLDFNAQNNADYFIPV